MRVPVRNLRQVDPSVDIDDLQAALGWEFLRTNVEGVDEGMEGATRQRGFTKVRPDNGYYPGIEQLREDLQSHQWIFGKTPRFKVQRSFALPEDLAPLQQQASLKTTTGTTTSNWVPLQPTPPPRSEIRIELDVHLGVIEVSLVLSPSHTVVSLLL